MARPAAPDAARQALHDLIEQSGDDAAALSRMIGRYSGYLRSFINGSGPDALTSDNRDRLAAYFGVVPEALGPHSTWSFGDTAARHHPKRSRHPLDRRAQRAFTPAAKSRHLGGII